MLRIQVLGSGLIPRGHGIAPKKEPFPADLNLIGIILSTGGLKVNFVHPDSGNLTALTRENYQAMYKKYQNRIYTKPVEVEESGHKEDTGAANPTSPVAPVVPTTVVAPVTPEVPVADAAKTEEFTMKPIVAPEEKPKNPQNNNGGNRNQPNGGQRNQNTNQR